MRHSLAIAIVTTAAISTSCLLDDDDGDGTNYIAVTEIEAAYKDAQCTYLVNCGTFATRDACLQAELSGGANYTLDPNIEAAIYGGHIVYNGSNVKACLDALANRSCDRTDATVREAPLECSLFFKGTRTAGQSCFIDQECVSQSCSGNSGSACDPGQCIGDTAPVVTRNPIGGNCVSQTGCVAGAYCDQDLAICTELKASGSTCTQDLECAYGTSCVGTTGASTCAALPAVGQPCNTDGICRDVGTYCDTTANQCKQYLLPGAQCTSSAQCSPYYPCDFAVTPNVCAQGPGLGEMCSGQTCFDAGTYCDFNASTPVCVAKKAAGALCDNSQECADGFCDFNQSTPVCTAPVSCF